MIEIRVRVTEDFAKRLISTCKVLGSWDMTDIYYKPKSMDWKPNETTMRIRFRKNGNSEIIFDKVKHVLTEKGYTVKRSLFGGKVKVFSGSFEDCKRILEDWGFEELFSIEKSGKAVKFSSGGGSFEIGVEHVKDLGWFVEVEGEGDYDRAVDDVIEKLELLGVDRENIVEGTLAHIYIKRFK